MPVKKTDIACALAARRRYPVKAVSDALTIARSTVYDRMKPKTTKQRGVYRMAHDRWLVPMIRKLVDQRPTYGYRRIQALLNRELKPQGRLGVNHKRVYRIMKQNNMLLSRYTGQRPMRAHNGTVITLRSNMRWCSDVFEMEKGVGPW